MFFFRHYAIDIMIYVHHIYWTLASVSIYEDQTVALLELNSQTMYKNDLIRAVKDSKETVTFFGRSEFKEIPRGHQTALISFCFHSCPFLILVAIQG